MSEVVACGIRYAKATASDYSGDPVHVTLIGFSFGGYLGSWIALGADSIDSSWEGHADNKKDRQHRLIVREIKLLSMWMPLLVLVEHIL